MVWTVVLEKTLESPLDCKEIQPVYPKGDQSGVFFGRTDVEAEILILWPPDMQSSLIWKDPDAGKDWGQAEKGMTEDEVLGWHHWLNGHEFEQAPGVGDGQRIWCAAVQGIIRVGQDWGTELRRTFCILGPKQNWSFIRPPFPKVLGIGAYRTLLMPLVLKGSFEKWTAVPNKIFKALVWMRL